MRPYLIAVLLAATTPAWALDLQVSPLWRGEAAHFSVSGATPGGTVLLVRSSNAPGSVPNQCPPQLGGACLGLGGVQILASVVADAQGLASLTRVLPANAPLQDVWFQAVQPGAAQLSSVVPSRVTEICRGDRVVRDAASLAALRDCGRVEGSLQVRDLTVTELDLPWLHEVRGSLSLIGMPALNSLAGLPRLGAVRGTLAFSGLPSLTSLVGLDALRSVDSLSLYDLPELTTLDGLELLDGMLVGLSIGRAHRLLDASALGPVTVHGALSLRDLPRLNVHSLDLRSTHLTDLTLSGTQQLTELPAWPVEVVSTSLTLEDLPVLPDLDGLPDLRALGGLRLSELPNLTDLSALGSVQFDPYLEAIELDDLPQLASLQPLAAPLAGVIWMGGLTINACPALTSLAGFTAQGTVYGELQITDNAALTEVNALAGLSAAGRVNLYELPALTDLTGLGGLGSVQEMTIALMPQVQHLPAFPQLHTLYWLAVVEMEGLLDLSGLEALHTVHTDLWIDDNLALRTLDGLDGLNHVGGELSLRNQPALTDVSALAALQSVGGELEILQNEALCNDDALSLALRVAPDNYVVRNNNDACP